MEKKSFVQRGVYLVLCMALALPALSLARGTLDLPTLPPPEMYGDVLMDKGSAAKGMIPVAFPHWVHRAKYACRVCHGELDFAMAANETGVVCGKGTMQGVYCAVCHNGKISFNAAEPGDDNCRRCHNAADSPNRDKFEALRKALPKSDSGNGIDWMRALKEGLITPKESLKEDAAPRKISIDKTLVLKAEMSGIPPGVFPHNAHEQWLDCANCHPDLFNIKKKTTRSLLMRNMVRGESCGLCHLRVAFPLDDCRRCHPGIKKR